MKNYKSSIVKLLKKYCPFTKNNSKQNNGSELGKSGFYYDFSPIDVCVDEDKISYEEEFNQIKYALENENVKNLAILGKFGTGKSSFVSSFFKHAKINNKKISEKEYVTVSLADFDYLKENLSDNIEDDLAGNSKSDKDNTYDTTDKKGCNESSENKIDSTNKNNHSSGKSSYQNLESVEKEIIRQLSYGKLSKNVPISFLSKFKTRLWDTFVISLYLSPLLVLVLSSFFIKDEIVHLFNYAPGCTLTKLLVLTAITAAYVFIFFKIISPRLRFKHISLSSLSISVEQIDSDNIIDAYLDEITYLFEQSKCKYVIFEDLDRGNNPEVFTHLRNLNIVLNNDIRCKNKNVCFWKRCQRRIVFIYLLRNDLLSPQEMVKFFDFTLSITPYAASSNVAFHALKIRDYICEYYKKLEGEKTCETGKTGGDKLEASQEIEVHGPADQQDKNTKYSSESKIFKKSELFTEESLDNDFIISVSRFVGDLRNIKQIFNDYQLLIGNFEFLFEDAKSIGKKIFSISVLKNYYPSDYNELISNKGKLYELLNREGAYKNFILKNADLCETVNELNNDKNIDNNTKCYNKFIENKKTDICFYPEEKYSFYDLVTKKHLIPEVCTYLFNRPLLGYLICRSYISEDYRFFVSKISKYFTLTNDECIFLRKVFDSNSSYQPNLKLSQEHLSLILSLLPTYPIFSKAILNVSLFLFMIKRRIDPSGIRSFLLLGKYIEKLLNGSFDNIGADFLLLLCSTLNNNLKKHSKNSKSDLNDLRFIFSAIFMNTVSFFKMMHLFQEEDKNIEFILYFLVYNPFFINENFKISRTKGVEHITSYLSFTDEGSALIDKLKIIPCEYWGIFFNTTNALEIVFDDLPNIDKTWSCKCRTLLYYLNKNSYKKSKKYSCIPFLPKANNFSNLAKIILGCDLQNSQDEFFINKDVYSEQYLSVIFDSKNIINFDYAILARSLLTYILFNFYNTLLLNVIDLLKRNELLVQDSDSPFLKDTPEIVISLILTYNIYFQKSKFSVLHTQTNLSDKHEFIEQSVNKINQILMNYSVNNSTLTDKEKIKLCFIDFECFCVTDLGSTLNFVKDQISDWKKLNLFDFSYSQLDLQFSLIETIYDLLSYSFVTKINLKTPRNRVEPNLKNVLFIRNLLFNFDSLSSNFYHRYVLEKTWFSLYTFYHKFYYEIYVKSQDSISHTLTELPNLHGSFKERLNQVKSFFLNLDKQD